MSNAQLILDAMPGTRIELAERTGLTPEHIAQVFARCLRPTDHHDKLAYICGWTDAPTTLQRKAIYARGGNLDVARKPVKPLSREQKLELSRAKYAQKRGREVVPPDGMTPEERIRRQRALEECDRIASIKQDPFSALFQIQEKK